MASTKTLLYYGALLHDVGKVMHRAGSASGAHAWAGADFISGEVAAANEAFANEDGKAIAEQIRYHHIEDLEVASELASDSLAYVTCFANLVATGMDRGNEGGKGWPGDVDTNARLRSIFNMLNGHHDDTAISHGEYGTIEESIRKG